LNEDPWRDEASLGLSDRSPPQGTEYMKKDVETIGIALPATVRVVPSNRRDRDGEMAVIND